jgi:transposase-like protein
MVGYGFIIVKENGETEMDDATEQLLIEMGVFRDLRCPYCDAKDVTTITVFERPARHRCCLCKREFSDDELERKIKRND